MELNSDGVVVLKDSGARTEFESGAARDIQKGKGRCDLMPLDIVGAFLDTPELIFIEKFKETKDVKFLYLSIESFCANTKMDMYTLMIEASKHYESGAIKYGENNWQKGMSLHTYLSSAVRHFLEYKRGDTDEPHDRAFAWNILCGAWTYLHKPDFDDVNAVATPQNSYKSLYPRPIETKGKNKKHLSMVEEYGDAEIRK